MKYLEDAGLLIKGTTETVNNELKSKRGIVGYAGCYIGC